MAKKLGLFKILSLALCIMVAPVMAACELVTINYDKQLNQAVSSFDNGTVMSQTLNHHHLWSRVQSLLFLQMFQKLRTEREQTSRL